MILPGATLGLLGGGQLGRMFTAQARRMGYEVVVLDPDPGSPAGALATRHLAASYTDAAALEEMARTTSVVTTEFENVSADALHLLATRVRVAPGATAVHTTQDRVREKQFLHDQGIATAPFAVVRTPDDLAGAWTQVGAPALFKTSQLGYDGKGQLPVCTLRDLEDAFTHLGGVPGVLEHRLPLETELSVVLARGDDGRVAAFPAGDNIHHQGILDTTTLPSALPASITEQATRCASLIAERLEYVGVLGVEFFVARGGLLYANEIAPRPHNSGHFTQDACTLCQFEQQVRAICGLPLGHPALLSPVCMINLLGDLWEHGPPRWDRVLDLPGVTLHLYGKATPRPGRKMGHLNCLAPTAAEAFALAHRARDLLVSGAPATQGT